MKKLKPRQVRRIFWIAFAVGAAAILAGTAGLKALLCVGIAVVLAASGFYLLSYNCPHCGRYLDRNAPDGFCPHCGKKIEE